MVTLKGLHSKWSKLLFIIQVLSVHKEEAIQVVEVEDKQYQYVVIIMMSRIIFPRNFLNPKSLDVATFRLLSTQLKTFQKS